MGIKMLNGSSRRLFSAERRMLEKRGDVIPDQTPFTPSQNPSADLAELMGAINELKDLVKPALPTQETPADLPEISVLRNQLQDLRDHIYDTKKEIASIHHPDEKDDRLTTAAMELDAIVAETELATHRILNATVEIGDILEKLKERSDDVGAHAFIDEANNKTIEIMEACNFQDLSGQRTTKVIKTINYLEERILSMIGIWGEDGFDGIEIEGESLEGDAALLHGPQHEEHAIDQADIDALFD